MSAGAGGVHADGHAPQGVAGVGGVNVLLACDAVEHAENDRVRPDELCHIPDGLFQYGGLDGDQKQVYRPTLGGGDVRELAFFAVTDDRLGSVAGNAILVGDDLHAGHFAPEQDAQCAQTDQGRSFDLFHTAFSFFSVLSAASTTVSPSSMPRRVSSLSG